MSRVQTAAARPYSVSLARSTTSDTSRNGNTVITGPKISSRAMRRSFDRASKIVGAT